MPIMYKPDEFAFFTEGDSLTEQEHKDQCDVNIMLRNAQRGLVINTRRNPAIYGDDDLTLDRVTHEIQKQRVTDELTRLANEQLTEEELKALPKDIKEKFKFKPKKQTQKQKQAEPETSYKTKVGEHDDERELAAKKHEAERIAKGASQASQEPRGATITNNP